MAKETPTSTKNGAGVNETNGIAHQKGQTGTLYGQTCSENNLRNLFHISLRALFWPHRYDKSIFGLPYTWFIPHREYSELTMLDLWRPLRMAAWFKDMALPAFSQEPPDLARTFLPPVIHELVWRPTTFFQQPDPYDSVTSFPRERWFYINGILWNDEITRLNAVLLSRMFHRPLTVIHNPTASFPLDLYECAVGKAFKTRPRPERPGTMTEPALKATQAILSALREPALDKVVVLAYSQGTIIAANVLRAIGRVLALETASEKAKETDGKASTQETSPDRNGISPEVYAGMNRLLDEMVGKVTNEPMQALRSMLAEDFLSFYSYVKEFKKDAGKKHPLKKLEIYTFANCADRMKYIDDSDGEPYPWLEHFANECDLVARLGILSPLFDPLNEEAPVDIDGPAYERLDAWGHLLAEHYLYAIDDYLSCKGPCSNPYPLRPQNRGTCQDEPRLYQYFQGKRPV